MGQAKTRQIAAREVVEAIDLLIQMRLLQGRHCPEEMEIVKRELTDFFLHIDKRPGIYVKGPHD